ncbi:MAG TPA: hypothetical protein VNQ53_05550 [Nocardioides sp.]|nr:hypothetical protein [Nocardioides sp.]
MSQGTERDPDKRIDSDRGTFDIQSDGQSADERESGTAGLPTEDDVPQETVEEIERERAERLDPDNRPEDTEVDNTDRTFDSGAGMFTDNENYDEAERPYVTEDGTEPPKPEEPGPSSRGPE